MTGVVALERVALSTSITVIVLSIARATLRFDVAEYRRRSAQSAVDRRILIVLVSRGCACRRAVVAGSRQPSVPPCARIDRRVVVLLRFERGLVIGQLEETARQRSSRQLAAGKHR